MGEVPAEGMLPPVVALAHPYIHAVLAICGFANVVDHMSIINYEGFQSTVDFSILEDKDVFEIVKCLGNCTVVAGCVNVGAIQEKNYKLFVIGYVIKRNMDRVLLRMIGMMTW
jgi:hypothetical protein